MLSLRGLPGIVVLVGCLVALGALPAAAGPSVYTANLVCADITFSPFAVAQSPASGRGTLKLAGASDLNFTAEIKGQRLPPGADVFCAAICVLDGAIDLFEFEIYSPCGTTTAGGKFTYQETRPFVAGEFDGGCLLPVVGFITASATADLTLCAPGFGNFGP